MYFKLLLCVVVLAVNKAGASPLSEKVSGARQKRLLFYDEEGNLVKTFKNPQSLDFIHNAEKAPFLGSLYGMLRHSTLGLPTVYMIPVSDQVIQQINTDPIYQNKFFTLPRKELVIEPNNLCAGKRTQIPSKDCRNFLNCWDGWAFEQECPEGLLFSKDGYCDYPLNVECGSRMKESTSAPSLPPSPQCGKDFEAMRSAQRCNEFFVCVDRAPVWFRCPSDLLYNQELGVCDYAYRVSCEQAVNSQDEASQPKPALAPAPAPAPNSSAPPCPASADAVSVNSQNATPTLPGGDSSNLKASRPDFRSQSWPSIHLALSRQDAIRQLQLKEDRRE